MIKLVCLIFYSIIVCPFWYRNECRLLFIEAVVCLLSSDTISRSIINLMNQLRNRTFTYKKGKHLLRTETQIQYSRKFPIEKWLTTKPKGPSFAKLLSFFCFSFSRVYKEYKNLWQTLADMIFPCLNFPSSFLVCISKLF